MDDHDCNNCGCDCDCEQGSVFCESCDSCKLDFYEDDYDDDLDDDNLDDNWTAPIVTFDDDGSDEGTD